MSPLNLQHHRQPPLPPLRRHHRRRRRLSVVAPAFTLPPSLPRATPRAEVGATLARAATDFFLHPSLHFYIHLNPSILNDGYFLRATVWIFIFCASGSCFRSLPLAFHLSFFFSFVFLPLVGILIKMEREKKHSGRRGRGRGGGDTRIRDKLQGDKSPSLRHGVHLTFRVSGICPSGIPG